MCCCATTAMGMARSPACPAGLLSFYLCKANSVFKLSARDSLSFCLSRSAAKRSTSSPLNTRCPPAVRIAASFSPRASFLTNSLETPSRRATSPVLKSCSFILPPYRWLMVLHHQPSTVRLYNKANPGINYNRSDLPSLVFAWLRGFS